MSGDPLCWPKVNPITEKRDLRKLCPSSVDFLRNMASLDGWDPACAERWIEAAEDMELLLEACRAALNSLVDAGADPEETAMVLLAELEKTVAKMSHRRCWECGHVAYYLDSTIPHCLCEECGSSDTRKIWTDRELARKEAGS